MRLPFLILALSGLWAPAAIAADRLTPDLASLATVPVVELPSASIGKNRQSTQSSKGRPEQFADRIPVSLDLASGRWDQAADGQARWRLRLHSPGAYSLHLNFGQFQLPPGAELWFYDSAGQLVQGPLTQAHETADGRLATALVTGDSAVLELKTPALLRDRIRLQVSEVFHGYRDIRSTAKAGGSTAGACERDVVCPEGGFWNPQIGSVVRLTFGRFFCSGQLLNNARLDDTPFLLTAHHCGIDSSNASTVVAYFNFQRPACGAGKGNLSQAISGATLRRSDFDSDTTLLVLNQKPPASFGAHLSGWDATGDPVNLGAGIHHPVGDEKKISLFCSAALKKNSACAAGFDDACDLRVDGWEVQWNSGVTEGGSSGSGLWNQQQRLVGTLSGGGSSCAPKDLDKPDVYGRFDVAWTTGGLEAELDPDNRLGAPVLNGKAVGGAVDASSTFTPANCVAPQVLPASPSGDSGGGALNSVTLAFCALLLGWRRSRPQRRLIQ